MSLLPAPAVFQSRDFSFYLTARFLSALAIQMQNVAVGWLVYDLTREPFALGLVGLASFLPAVALALVTGHVADRYDRRKILVACYLVTLATAVGLLTYAHRHARGATSTFAGRQLFERVTGTMRRWVAELF